MMANRLKEFAPAAGDYYALVGRGLSAQLGIMVVVDAVKSKPKREGRPTR